MPKVSIVIRSHNDSAFISDTLKVLLSQDFKDFEIISCDDASTDGTAEIIASFPQVIRLERPEGRYVPGKTLNRAIPQCHGEIIVFILRHRGLWQPAAAGRRPGIGAERFGTRLRRRQNLRQLAEFLLSGEFRHTASGVAGLSV